MVRSWDMSRNTRSGENGVFGDSSPNGYQKFKWKFGIQFEYLPHSGYCQPFGDFSLFVPNKGPGDFSPFVPNSAFLPKSPLSMGPLLASSLNGQPSGIFCHFSPLHAFLDISGSRSREYKQWPAALQSSVLPTELILLRLSLLKLSQRWARKMNCWWKDLSTSLSLRKC